jgi:hypothetical protein
MDSHVAKPIEAAALFRALSDMTRTPELPEEPAADVA